MEAEAGTARRVLCLFGGGLDSRLACAWVARKGYRSTCLHFDTGFVHDGRGEAVLAHRAIHPDTEIVDVAEDYLREVVLRPRYGYAGGMNPCLDCRIFMLRRADRLARARGIEILCTGEVVGQRRLDQSRRALALAEREAGVESRVLRPLSSALLPPLAGRSGVATADGEELRFHGRTRRAQLELAARLGLPGETGWSGRCCKLADPGFASRLRDLIAHGDVDEPSFRERLRRLDQGRHFRLAWDLKVIVGRDRQESTWLREHAGEDWVAQVANGHGALCVLEGQPTADREAIVGSLVARYASPRREPIEIELRRGIERRFVRAAPAAEVDLARWRI